MTDTTTIYNLLESTPTGTYSVRNGFSSYAEAWEFANKRLSRQEQEYKIQRVVTTRSIEEIFTIPAMAPPTLEEIADAIIGDSDGSFNIEWGEDFEALEVEDMVDREISSCDCCGWHWHIESMEQHIDSGDMLCYKCAEDREEEENESEDEDDED